MMLTLRAKVLNNQIKRVLDATFTEYKSLLKMMTLPRFNLIFRSYKTCMVISKSITFTNCSQKYTLRIVNYN